MAGPRKNVDWKLIEKEYVTEGKSARDLARSYGLSNSTISDRARREDWEGRKMAYSASVARRSYEKMADNVADERGAILTENILAARMYIRQFISDVSTGKISTNARDAVAMAQLLVRELTAEIPEDHTGEQTVIEMEQPQDESFLRGILEVARTRVVDPGAVGPALLVDPKETRPN